MSDGAKPRPVLIVSGLSGAGRATALKALEDLGHEAVDNLPLGLIDGMLAGSQGGKPPLVLGLDVRSRDFGIGQMIEAVERLRGRNDLLARLLFLDCDDEILVRRYTETRRRHPLAQDRPVLAGIQEERAFLRPLRATADDVIDTTQMTAADLKRVIGQRFAATREGMALAVVSFSYRLGLPREADLVLDARFLRNPHYEAALRPLSGRDRPVQAFIEADPDFAGFMSEIKALLGRLLPRFQAEGKSYLTVAVGCTGGQHRSVFVAERLGEFLAGSGRQASVSHRDMQSSAGAPAR